MLSQILQCLTTHCNRFWKCIALLLLWDRFCSISHYAESECFPLHFRFCSVFLYTESESCITLSQILQFLQLCWVRLCSVSVPDRVVRVQQALFNSPLGIWAENKYMLLCIVAMPLRRLNLWRVSVWFICAWDLGLWIYSKIWASKVLGSQAKPPMWEALESVESHVAEANVNQSALEQKPGWTHLLQCQRRISCVSIYKFLVTNRRKDNS
jgi:hypothetical protein